MKKELAAAALLLAIFAADLWNGRHLEALLARMDAGADTALTAAETEHWQEACAEAVSLAGCWQSEADYARVFLRQSDIDAVAETLSALRGAAVGQDYPACLSAVLSLHTRLGSIRDTEKLSLGSVF